MEEEAHREHPLEVLVGEELLPYQVRVVVEVLLPFLVEEVEVVPHPEKVVVEEHHPFLVGEEEEEPHPFLEEEVEVVRLPYQVRAVMGVLLPSEEEEGEVVPLPCQVRGVAEALHLFLVVGVEVVHCQTQ